MEPVHEHHILDIGFTSYVVWDWSGIRVRIVLREERKIIVEKILGIN